MAFLISPSEKFYVHAISVYDLLDLLPLVTAYRVFYEQLPNEERERDFITQNMSQKRSTIFIARNAGGDAVGFVQLFQTFSTVHLGPQFILEDLFVVPRARGSGVASKLLERAIQYAKETGVTGMFLETAMDNEAAQAVYERNGWTREGRFYKYNAPL